MRTAGKPLRTADDSEEFTIPLLPPNASIAKRWRFRRNIVIFIAHRAGLSQRMLADVFDLPRSRISAIIKEVASVVS